MTDEEWLRVRKFLRAVRRHWPGARIVIRPEPPEPQDRPLDEVTEEKGYTDDF